MAEEDLCLDDPCLVDADECYEDVCLVETDGTSEEQVQVDREEFNRQYTQNRVLDKEEIGRRQSQVIKEAAGLLSISLVESSLLLRYFKWSPQLLCESWFSDEDSVCRKTGFCAKTRAKGNTEEKVLCAICFDDFSLENTRFALCFEHAFCEECWAFYLESKISEGSGCITVRCPHPKCGAAVPDDMVLSLVSESLAAKYRGYLLTSYVEMCMNIKWCPAPNCEYALEEVDDHDEEEVHCRCSAVFCWSCMQEPHMAISCEMVSNWEEKNTSEAGNTEWIKANTKMCPKCRRPIEKNAGCMHMTCKAPCGHQFCWICLADWKGHSHLTCNAYRKETPDEKERKKAQNDLQRYMHYYERFAANAQSQKKATSDLERLPEVLNKRIIKCKEVKITDLDISDLEFVVEALKEIVRCRRILKWTYVYAYYLSDEKSNQAKLELYDFLQQHAVSSLEKLHEFVEKTPIGLNSSTMAEYKYRLVSLTTITRQYFDNFAKSLKAGLTEVSTSSGSKRERKEKGKTSKKSKKKKKTVFEDEEWICNVCTYFNMVPSATVCEVCRSARQS